MAERVVNIIGLGHSAKMMPDTGEMWGINVAYMYGKLDKMFFMDDFSVIQADDSLMPKILGRDMWVAIKENPAMEVFSRNQFVITNSETNEVINVNKYPVDQALDLLPGMYFNCTLAYVIAYAILEKVDRIRLYGLEIWSKSSTNEYNYQRPCIEFWLAFAMGRGIKVEIPYQLLHTIQCSQNLYGYKEKEL